MNRENGIKKTVGATRCGKRAGIRFAAVLCLLFAGCAAPPLGRPIPVQAVQRIRPGFTTRDEIIAMMGQPLRVVAGETGEIWVYRYLDGRGAAQDLIVSFTADMVGTFSFR